MHKAPIIINKQKIIIFNINPFADFLKYSKLVTIWGKVKKYAALVTECPEGLPYPELQTISKISLSQYGLPFL
jgi:hypothetical protein